MEFAEVIKAYSEIGLLGLCAVLMIILFYKQFKKNQDNDDAKSATIKHKDAITESHYDSLLNLFQSQIQQIQNQQMQNNEILINTIANKINNHVTSPQENEKLTKITERINTILQELLIETNADRVNVVQYHNGGRGINKQSFLKMSITNEQVRLGVKPFISEFRDQFRSVLSYFVKEINDKGYCYIEDIENIKTLDVGTYEFLADRKIHAKYGMAIRNSEENFVMGFVSIEFINKEDANTELVDKLLKEKHDSLIELLNL